MSGPFGPRSRAIRRSLTMVFTSVLALCMTVSPVLAKEAKQAAFGAVTASAVDDAIPGVALPASPFSGSVDSVTDPDDIFSIYLGVGQTLQVNIELTSGTGDLDAALFPPGSTSVESLGDAVVVARNAGRAAESISYTVLYGSAGVYYLDIYPYSGASGYTVTWSITGGGLQGRLPGAPLPPSPIEGFLDGEQGDEDVFNVVLAPGQTLDVSLSLTTGTGDLDMALFPPGTTDISSLANAVATSRISGRVTEHIAYTVPRGRGGTYYLDVWPYAGASGYSLTWNISGGGGTASLFCEPAVSSSVVAFGKSVFIGCSLRDALAPVAGLALFLEESDDGSTWRMRSMHVTDASGSCVVPVSVDRRTYLRWRYPGDATYAAMTSDRVTVTPKVRISPPSIPATMRSGPNGKWFSFSGTIEPRHRSGTLRIYYEVYEDGRWKKWFWKNLSVSDDGAVTRYRGKQWIWVDMRYRMRARMYFKDHDHAATYSSWRYFTMLP